ncbi:hypothetical protein NONO_c24700 [Nocardia nova SH22a]|uniref:Uncharacterized protein n=1 Tax=Nocardia nova SH22a TaxID=1415166 RepID=W5TJ33_9NOCA|nr:hypothetical protein [Nocardia nova]AHH17266.1 hypothetical protein NONO_c24700 [Nocardia nova SH22a]
MRSGLTTEAHVVVYCDGCGDQYSETRYDRTCFASMGEAIAYIAGRGAGVGWVYDGDRILCDGCIASARCADHGHCFPNSDAPACSVCGISETEIEELS